MFFGRPQEIGRVRQSYLAPSYFNADWLIFVLKKLRRAPRGEILS